jgi:hypothetical protein
MTEVQGKHSPRMRHIEPLHGVPLVDILVLGPQRPQYQDLRSGFDSVNFLSVLYILTQRPGPEAEDDTCSMVQKRIFLFILPAEGIPGMSRDGMSLWSLVNFPT